MATGSTISFSEQEHRAKSVRFNADRLEIELADGRIVSAPLSWYPRLEQGTPNERQNNQFIGDGLGIHWPELDEDISVEGILAGRPSMETKKSFQHWLKRRNAAAQALGRTLNSLNSVRNNLQLQTIILKPRRAPKRRAARVRRKHFHG